MSANLARPGTTELMRTGPWASIALKRPEARNELSAEMIGEPIRDHAATQLAKRAGGPDGREGIATFVEQRKPGWAR